MYPHEEISKQYTLAQSPDLNWIEAIWCNVLEDIEETSDHQPQADRASIAAWDRVVYHDHLVKADTLQQVVKRKGCEL